MIRMISEMIFPNMNDTVTSISITIGVFALDVSVTLFSTSIDDMVYHDEDMLC